MASLQCSTMDMDGDFLDAVFMNENRCQDEGFLEGQNDGRRKGLQDGLHLGCQKGCEVGAELGFYVGFAETIRQGAEGSKSKIRILKAIESLSQMIESFPLMEPKNPNLHEQVQAIRAKFKQVTSLLGIQTRFTPGGVPQGASF